MDFCVSANTWTHIELESEAFSWSGSGWRVVEAQHKVATMGLVGHHVPDQSLLEEILEEFKPPLPPAAEPLHWLLSTPFRYPPPPAGSRFRREGDDGVFYGAEEKATACAEAGYWRLQFWRDSDALRGQATSMPLTLFRFEADVQRMLDLTQPPLSDFAGLWADPHDYSHTQTLAAHARERGIHGLRYASVRDPGGRCFALLTPAVFGARETPRVQEQETWTFYIHSDTEVVFQRDLSANESFAFTFN